MIIRNTAILTLLCPALLCLTLSACGFALRGSDVVSANFSALALSLAQPDSEFSRLLRRSLDVADVATSLGARSDTPTLRLGPERVVSRPVSVNPRARAAQYEIRLSVVMSLQHNGSEIIPEQTLTVQRSYFEDIANIVGNQQEIAIITAEMRRDLVNQLMRRLEAVEL